MASPTSAVLHLSETPRSSIAVGTATSSTSPSATSGSSGSGGFFSTAGSPALVLAFLAIGIFAGGLLSMLFLRHVGIIRLMRQRQMAMAQEAVPAEDQFFLGRRSRRRAFGEQPKLWEYEHHSQTENAKSWDQVVPISVKAIPPLPILPMASVDPSLSNPRTGMLSHWLKRQPTPPSSSSTQYTPGRLHLTVAIAMPTRNIPSSNSRNPVIPVYELGFLDTPWAAENFASLNAAAPPSTPGINTAEGS